MPVGAADLCYTMAEAGDSIGASEPISCTAAASRPSLESKLQTAENTKEKYYLTAYFAASTATLITDVPAALEAALTAAWHAVGLTVGPAVVLDALATCNATCTPTFIGCFLCRAYSCCRPADADATTESIKHVLCFNSQCNRYTQWYCSCCCHWLRLSLPLLP